jgi:hypothetical protein
MFLVRWQGADSLIEIVQVEHLLALRHGAERLQADRANNGTEVRADVQTLCEHTYIRRGKVKEC